MTEEIKSICKEVLSDFIYKIRMENSIYKIVYTYYISDYSQMMQGNITKIGQDFESLKIQIKRRILTERNNYWALDIEKAKVVEDLAINNEKEYDFLKPLINSLFKSDMKSQQKEMEKKEKDLKDKELNRLKEILKEKYEFYREVCYKIIHDEREFAYKSDKIKIFLEIGLDVDTIFYILSDYKKWMAPRSYIDKYSKERHQAILDGKKKRDDPQKVLKDVLKRLSSIE